MSENSEHLNWKRVVHLCPDDILEAEVQRRMEQQRIGEIPKMRPMRLFGDEDPLKPLADLCQSYIDQLAEIEPYCDNKLAHYIFEAAMQFFFGKDVFQWVNKRLK